MATTIRYFLTLALITLILTACGGGGGGEDNGGFTSYFSVTPTAGANGAISPLSVQRIVNGATTTFTVTPVAGYSVTMGGTCGGTLSGTTYTTNAITADCSVDASFSNISLPTAPTVVTQTTASTTPTLTGTFDSAVAAGGFSVTINSVSYPLSGANLTNKGDNWSLTIPAGDALTLGTYEVVATVTDGAGNASSDISSNELTIQGGSGTAPLNDTGLTWGGNYPSGNNTTCIGETIAEQDCSSGRDFSDNDDSDGHAGFSFTKLDANGNDLAVSASSWSCVRDNITGLIWEVKQGGNGIAGDEGLHDADDRYNWYNTDSATNGGGAGYADEFGNICFGYDAMDSSTFCNTEAYVARVNAAGLCGASDWRLPKKEPLRSIVSYDRTDPVIDTRWFPNTIPMYYWSSSAYADNLSHAWVINFNFGNDLNDVSRRSNHFARLVRTGQ